MLQVGAAWGWAVVCSLLLASAPAQPDRREVVRQCFLESFGREGREGEVNYWLARQGWKSEHELIDLQLIALRSDPALQEDAVRGAYRAISRTMPGQAVLDYWKRDLGRQPRAQAQLMEDVRKWSSQRDVFIRNAYQAAFGRAANEQELKYWQTRVDWKAQSELVELHRNFVRNNAAVVDSVIRNAFMNVFGREPLASEWDHWRQQVSAGRLAADIELQHREWVQRNAAPVQKTAAWIEALGRKGLGIDTRGNLVSLEGATMVEGAAIVAAGSAKVVHRNGTYSLTDPAGMTLVSFDGKVIVRRDQ